MCYSSPIGNIEQGAQLPTPPKSHAGVLTRSPHYCMDRPKRAATKITDYRKYHLSGDLQQEVEGLVDTRVGQFEMALSAEQIKQQLEKEKETSQQLEEDVELLRLQNEMDKEKKKQEQLHMAYNKLKEARERANQEHEECMEEMEALASKKKIPNPTLEWFKAQLGQVGMGQEESQVCPEEHEASIRDQQVKMAAIRKIKAQQEELNKQLADLEGNPSETPPEDILGQLKKALGSQDGAKTRQESQLQQLRAALSGKKEDDPTRTLLKALITPQNRTTAEGGTNTLRPSMMNKIMMGDSSNMAEWLASLNKQEEGESEFAKFPFPGEDEGTGRPTRIKSGMLDKATTNIQQKQVWPQQPRGGLGR